MPIIKSPRDPRNGCLPYRLLSEKVAILLWAAIHFPREVEVEIRLPIEVVLSFQDRKNAYLAFHARLFVRKDWGQVIYLHIPYWVELCARTFLRGV